MRNIGLYVHIPFCQSKCPYCDFYSFRCKDADKERYTELLIKEIRQKSAELSCKADTLYIGGGTPSYMGSDLLSRIITSARECFSLDDGAEITVECNPHCVSPEFFEKIVRSGVNRISLGVQSVNSNERKLLGRLSDAVEVENAVKSARQSGIKNISLDIMLGIPESTVESLEKTLEFCVCQDVEHISCYILKIEENTPFFKMRDKLALPDEDTVADMYEFMCGYLKKNGYTHYEISNFSKKGYESRHNLKYWNCEEYLGLGSSAHSFLNGRRFYCEKSTDGFSYVSDGNGGDFEEYAMLRLRLEQGISESETLKRFSHPIPEKIYEKAKKLSEYGYTVCTGDSVKLTEKGFLISNSVISQLIY